MDAIPGTHAKHEALVVLCSGRWVINCAAWCLNFSEEQARSGRVARGFRIVHVFGLTSSCGLDLFFYRYQHLVCKTCAILDATMAGDQATYVYHYLLVQMILNQNEFTAHELPQQQRQIMLEARLFRNLCWGLHFGPSSSNKNCYGNTHSSFNSPPVFIFFPLCTSSSSDVLFSTAIMNLLLSR